MPGHSEVSFRQKLNFYGNLEKPGTHVLSFHTWLVVGLGSINTAASESTHVCGAKHGAVVRKNREFTGTFGCTPRGGSIMRFVLRRRK
jgi:hypothetical protein